MNFCLKLATYSSLIFLLSCTKEKEFSSVPSLKGSEASTNKELTVDNQGLSKITAIMKTVHGNVYFKFYPIKAPNSVTRIISLINSGFYDGMPFHRVVPNFVVQVGDPTGTGNGGSGKRLKAEFNDISHIKGTIGLARSKDIDSADSQIYISLNSLPHLDKNYTVIGQVTKGLEILSKISKGDKIISLSLTNKNVSLL